MLISKTPLRISFFGGGSDLEHYFREFGGAVLSTAIDKFVFVAMNDKFDDAVRVAYSINEEVLNASDLQHPIVRNVLRKYEIGNGLEIATIADIPARGTGLGSSSAFTVGLLNCLRAYLKLESNPHDLAAEACDVEIQLCNEVAGWQDQFACAFGGLNLIEFNKDGTVQVKAFEGSQKTLRDLQKNLLLLYTGITRKSSTILQDQVSSSSRKKGSILSQMKEMAYQNFESLSRGNLSDFGYSLYDAWEQKKKLSSQISDPRLDHWYNTAIEAGAVGGKLLGAGGGGFFLFYAEQSLHADIIASLPELKPMPFRFNVHGTSVSYF